jgi:hypothetical protein
MHSHNGCLPPQPLLSLHSHKCITLLRRLARELLLLQLGLGDTESRLEPCLLDAHVFCMTRVLLAACGNAHTAAVTEVCVSSLTFLPLPLPLSPPLALQAPPLSPECRDLCMYRRVAGSYSSKTPCRLVTCGLGARATAGSLDMEIGKIDVCLYESSASHMLDGLSWYVLT